MCRVIDITFPSDDIMRPIDDEFIVWVRCNRGDVMGCGIQFPVDYVSRSIGSDDEEEDEADEDEPDQELDARIDALQGELIFPL